MNGLKLTLGTLLGITSVWMIINGNGPERVNIAFRSSNHLSRLRAEWRGAELQVEIFEESRRR